jgi:hypothetical protein
MLVVPLRADRSTARRGREEEQWEVGRVGTGGRGKVKQGVEYWSKKMPEEKPDSRNPTLFLHYSTTHLLHYHNRASDRFGRAKARMSERVNEDGKLDPVDKSTSQLVTQSSGARWGMAGDTLIPA